MNVLIYYIVVGIFLVLWHYIIEPFTSKKIAQKSMKSGEISKFKSLGFKVYEDRLYGNYKDYVVIVARYWNIIPRLFCKNSAVSIYILYTPLQSQIDKYFYNNFHFTFNDKYNGWLNEFQYYIQFRTKMPKYETILSEIDQMITFLKENNMEPISEQDSDKIYDKYAEYFIHPS